ncbi:MAG: tetratricopeptide repeat protein, partial [Chitinophagales bacterium]
ENVYLTFIHTGMGESFDNATQEKSSAKFDSHAYVYDKYKNFWYHPFWRDSTLFIKEFRVEGKDTAYQRMEKISFIVGSGQHTNSHIWNENGFLYQAPLTFYTQKGIWDLPPGFDDGENSRWNRIISVECMNCHNMYPQFDSSSENKFISVKTGIECERCHGPGSIHVQEKTAGILVDTSKEIDYSIVNPKKLPRDLQVELCQRCHLQGISVLNEGKTFFDFKPGMKLSEVENVFMPRYEGNPNKFIMASHADRMKQSKCYQNSNMTCLTCHDPHVSVKVTPPDHFNNACISCHSSPKQECPLPLAERLKEDNNCYKCHMPVNETLDIPHVTVHDHRIQIPVAKSTQDSILKFVKLECMTTKNPSPLLMAEGYLQTYEAYSPQPFLLDSAKKYLDKISDESQEVIINKIRLSFLKQDYASVIDLSSKLDSKENPDAWTMYRIGESFYQSGNFVSAENYFSKAVAKENLNLEFLNKLGIALLAANKMDSAEAVFKKCVDANPKFAPAVNNLGYVSLLKGDVNYANTLFDKALALDPDYEAALMNKAALLMSEQNSADAKKILERVLQIDPKNEKAKETLRNMLVQ